MAKRKVEVFLKPSAERQITAIAVYIEERGYPMTAEKFAARLYKFAETLGRFPLKYPTCRNELLAIRNFRCAVFQKNYIFVYKVSGNHLTIHQVAHASRLQ